MMKATITLTISLALFCLTPSLRAQTSVRFEDFTVAVFRGRIHMPRTMRRINDDEWRDNAGKLVHSPHVNFAGKYFIAIHSCGTGCRYYTLTDLSSGRELDLLKDFDAAEPPPKTREGLTYITDLVTRAESKLLVAQYHIDSPRGAECRERAFVFDQGKLTPLGGTRRSCTDY